MTAKMQPFWWFKKPAITCPEGEQLTNGDFELGNLTGWEIIQGWAEAWTDNPHSGIYSGMLGEWCFIRQTLATPLLVSCVLEFKFWARHESTYDSGLITVIAHYTDATESSADVYAPYTLEYEQFDLLFMLESGKTIEYIEFQAKGDPIHTHIDDVSMISGT